MTALMEKQLITMAVMIFCGMTAGLIDDMGIRLSNRVKKKSVTLGAVSRITVFCITAYMTGTYLYYCDYGKISGTAIISFIMGVWLWKRRICGKIKD